MAQLWLILCSLTPKFQLRPVAFLWTNLNLDSLIENYIFHASSLQSDLRL